MDSQYNDHILNHTQQRQNILISILIPLMQLKITVDSRNSRWRQIISLLRLFFFSQSPLMCLPHEVGRPVTVICRAYSIALISLVIFRSGILLVCFMNRPESQGGKVTVTESQVNLVSRLEGFTTVTVGLQYSKHCCFQTKRQCCFRYMTWMFGNS